jgi:hypothetical protein
MKNKRHFDAKVDLLLEGMSGNIDSLWNGFKCLTSVLINEMHINNTDK